MIVCNVCCFVAFIMGSKEKRMRREKKGGKNHFTAWLFDLSSVKWISAIETALLACYIYFSCVVCPFFTLLFYTLHLSKKFNSCSWILHAAFHCQNVFSNANSERLLFFYHSSKTPQALTVKDTKEKLDQVGQQSMNNTQIWNFFSAFFWLPSAECREWYVWELWKKVRLFLVFLRRAEKGFMPLLTSW